MSPKDAQILLNGTWEHITSRGPRGLACVRKLRVLIISGYPDGPDVITSS